MPSKKGDWYSKKYTKIQKDLYSAFDGMQIFCIRLTIVGTMTTRNNKGTHQYHNPKSDLAPK